MTASPHSGPARQPLIDVDDISKHFGSVIALSGVTTTTSSRSATPSPCSTAARPSAPSKEDTTREQILEMMSGGKELADLDAELAEFARADASRADAVQAGRAGALA